MFTPNHAMNNDNAVMFGGLQTLERTDKSFSTDKVWTHDMLERLYNLPSAGGGGGGGSGDDNNRGGGGDNGGNSGKRVITEAEKYSLKGLFADEVAKQIYHDTDNPLTEINRINDVRSYIESPKMPFKMCYDLD